MLNKFHEKQQGMEMIILEQLVPQDYLQRKIDRSIDFSFIRRLWLPVVRVRLPDFQSASSACQYQALIGPNQATGYAGGFD